MTIIPDVPERYLIYAFKLTHDPSHEYRYVGQTSRGISRFYEHINEARSLSHPRYLSKKATWVRDHYYAITFEILEVCETVDILNDCEIRWIHILKERGHDLLNETNGGSGTRGFSPVWSSETKAKISASKLGHPVSPETRAKLSSAQQGKSLSESTKRKILQTKEANGTLNHSQQTKSKMSETHKKRFETMGHPGHSQEVRDKLSATRKTMDIDNSKSLHVRWHEKRNKPSPACVHCNTTLKEKDLSFL